MRALLGATMRCWRERAGLTRKALAGRMGSQEASVARWETGRGLPAIATLIVVAELCGADVHEAVDALLASRKSSARVLKADPTVGSLSARAGAISRSAPAGVLLGSVPPRSLEQPTAGAGAVPAPWGGMPSPQVAEDRWQMSLHPGWRG